VLRDVVCSYRTDTKTHLLAIRITSSNVGHRVEVTDTLKSALPIKVPPSLDCSAHCRRPSADGVRNSGRRNTENGSCIGWALAAQDNATLASGRTTGLSAARVSSKYSSEQSKVRDRSASSTGQRLNQACRVGGGSESERERTNSVSLSVFAGRSEKVYGSEEGDGVGGREAPGDKVACCEERT